MTIIKKKSINKKTGEVKIYEYESDYFKQYYFATQGLQKRRNHM